MKIDKMSLKKKKILLLYVQTYQKKKEVPYMEMSCDNDQKWKESPFMECHVTMNKNGAYISNEMQLQNHSLAFIHKNESLLSTTSILCRSPMAYNTTATLDKLSCTNYVDFGKRQERFGQFSWSKNDSNFLDIKLKVFKREDKNWLWKILFGLYIMLLESF